MSKRKLIAVIVAFSLVAAMLAACGDKKEEGGKSADAKGVTVELVVQNHDPATSVCGQFLEAWGGMIEKACADLDSGNKIKFTYYHGGSLGGATDSVDMVQNGTADIAWSVAGIYSGRFPVAEGVMLPLLDIKNSRDGSAALMDMYKESPELQKEFEDFYLIELNSSGYHPLELAKKKAETVADLKGLRIRTPGATVNPFLEGLGVSPMVIPTPETYESLQKNVIDGCINDWHNVAANKLGEIIKYIVDYPFFCSRQFMIMNKDKYNSLPDDLKGIIDQYSKEYASQMAGKFWDSTRAWVIDNPLNSEIYTPNEEFIKALEPAAQKAYDAYIENLNKAGIDGKAVFEKWREVATKHGGKSNFDSPIDLSEYGVKVEQKS